MIDKHLRYQLVQKSDGILAIHEIVVDDDENVTAFSYDPVKLEADSVGEIASILKQVYRDMRLYPVMSEDELDVLMNYREPSDDEIVDDEEKVINLVDYLSAQN